MRSRGRIDRARCWAGSRAVARWVIQGLSSKRAPTRRANRCCGGWLGTWAPAWDSRGRSARATAARSSSDGLNSFLDGTRFGPEDKAEKEPVGRAWETSELRLKSFEDLQGLWYVLLREKHMLSTEKYAARGARVRMRAPHRIKMIRRSMAKIKTVLTERIDEDAGDDTELRRKFMSVINAK